MEGSGAPTSQTLTVPSRDPDKIVTPFGEKATDMTQSLWALVLSLNSSIVPARKANQRQFWPRRGDWRAPWRTKIADFDRLVS